MKVQIVLNHPDHDAPADRRRMRVLLRELPALGIQACEYDGTNDFDALIIAQAQRYATWLPVARRARRDGKVVVHDVTNDSFAGTTSMAAAEGRRGVERLRFGVRRARWPIQAMLRIGNWGKAAPFWRTCSAIVTGSQAQADKYSPYCTRRFALVDSVPEEEYASRAVHGERSPIVLGWEATRDNAPYLLPYASAFRSLHDRGIATLRVVMDVERSTPFDGESDNRKLLARWGIPADFVEWKSETFARDLAECDVGIAPLPLNDEFAASKPANKILGFASMGMPVIATSIAAYEDVNKAAGFARLVRTPDEWVNAVEALAGDWKLRQEMGERGRNLVEATARPALFAHAYARILRSVSAGGGL